MTFLSPTCRLILFLQALCFVVVFAMGQNGRTVTAKQGISTAGKTAPCFNAPYGAESQQRESEVIASLPNGARFWLTEDAVYIISPEERCAFLHLATHEDRDHFIEQFWSRRAPDPTSLDNSVKREHYARIVFANKKFSGQLPGWKTDRGRVYVTYGPPDSIESHQSGEKTGRPPEEGPETYEFSWEAWHYRRIDGVRENVEVEFVDPSGSGDYRLALGAEEKELFFAAAYNLGRPRQGTGTTKAIEIYVGPAPTPLVQFKDLEAMVVSRITRQQVQFSKRIEFASATHATTVAWILVDVPSEQQSSSSKRAEPVTEFEVFGRVSKPSGWVVDTFERKVSVAGEASSEHSQPDSQFQLALEPGLYRLAIVVRDSANGDTGTLYTAFAVPAYEKVHGSE